MEVKLTRTRVITETATVEVDESAMRENGYDPDDNDEIQRYSDDTDLGQFVEWETEGWEDVDEVHAEFEGY